MDSEKIIMFLIIFCLVFIALCLLANPIKAVLKFLVRGALGILAIALLKGFGLGLGLNPLCAGIIGMLGIPGFFSLFIISLII